MKQTIIVLFGILFLLSIGALAAPEDSLPAQEEEDFLGGDEEEFKKGDTALKAKEEEPRKQEEAGSLEQAKREAINRRAVKERKIAKEKALELDAMREAAADTTEYTINPDAVELVVELDPNNYGLERVIIV